jgi:hypothetical protein
MDQSISAEVRIRHRKLWSSATTVVNVVDRVTTLNLIRFRHVTGIEANRGQGSKVRHEQAGVRFPRHARAE